MATDKRRRMIAGTLVLGLLAIGLLALMLPQGPVRAATRRTVSSTAASFATITINRNPGMMLAPAPSSAAPALTAQQAWRRYARSARSHRTSIPAGVTARLGLFTLPVGTADNPAIVAGADNGLTISGDEAYSSLNQLVYGYSWHSCPLIAGGPGMSTPPSPCIEWLFLEANTGRMIVETWQQ